MRVLKVLPGVTPDAGTERSFLATAPGLVAKGVELHLALLTERQSLVPELEKLGVVIHDLSSVHGVGARARSIRTLIRRLEPDLVHASLFEATLPSQLASLRTGVPILISWVNTNYGSARTVEPGSSRWKVAAYQLIEMTLGRLSGSWYHAVTHGVGQFNARALRVDPERVLVAERGRDPAIFSPPDEGAVLPERLPVSSSDGPKLLAIGRQEPQKGYESLLAAFDDLADTDPSVELLIAGRVGSATPSLEPIHSSLRHGDRVTFLGQRDDIPQLIASVDVVVCASWREGAAGALIESMACGTPVVSVPLVGIDGILIDGVNAVVTPRNQLADGIRRVLDDPEFAARLAKAGQQTFEERFTISAATARLLEVYRTVIGEQ